VVDEAIDVAPVEEMVEKILKSDTDHLQNRTDSILIVRNGHLVLEEYFWGADRNQPHQISSDTKSLTSMLFGLACDKGLLEVEQKTISFFKDYPDTVWVKNKYAITLDNLLSMEANVEWNEDLPYQDPRNTAIGLVNADDPIQYVLNRPRIGPPGARYKYNSGLPNLIGDVLRRSIGEPLEEFAEHELFSILDIKNYRWARQKNGEILSAGGFSMRPIDAAKLGQLMLDKGVWRGRQIISQDWVDRSTRRQTGVDDYAYGYYWHLGDQQNKKLAPWEGYMAIGQGGQYIIVIPSAKVVVVLNSSNWQPGGTELAFNEIIQPFILPSIKQAVRR
jgi:CubicO group peptidase (beta-lactamase class C family)